MIGHEAIVVEAETEAVGVASDQVKEGAAILVIGENRRAVMTAVHDVIASFSGPVQPTRQAWHLPFLPVPGP
jgi:hypothetical protein